MTHHLSIRELGVDLFNGAYRSTNLCGGNLKFPIPHVHINIYLQLCQAQINSQGLNISSRHWKNLLERTMLKFYLLLA